MWDAGQNPGGEMVKMDTMRPLAKWRTEHGEDGPDKVKLAVPADEKFTQMQPACVREAERRGREGAGCRRGEAAEGGP